MNMTRDEIVKRATSIWGGVRLVVVQTRGRWEVYRGAEDEWHCLDVDGIATCHPECLRLGRLLDYAEVVPPVVEAPRMNLSRDEIVTRASTIWGSARPIVASLGPCGTWVVVHGSEHHSLSVDGSVRCHQACRLRASSADWEGKESTREHEAAKRHERYGALVSMCAGRYPEHMDRADLDALDALSWLMGNGRRQVTRLLEAQLTALRRRLEDR
jgi:hypothetical protein